MADSKLVDNDEKSSKVDHVPSKHNYNEQYDSKLASDDSDDSEMDFFGMLYFWNFIYQFNEHPTRAICACACACR